MLKLTKELVVNWHITEACNYKCDYCFAKWDSNSKEVLHSPIKIETLIEQIDNIRHVLNKSNKNVYFDQLRLNLVGGETFLYGKQLKNIINLAKKYNFRLSAISNGSLFNEIDMKFIAQNFSSLGVSVDSINEYTNAAIGRTSKQNTFNPSQVLKAINQIKKYNPMIEIKINTVDSYINELLYFNSFLIDSFINQRKMFRYYRAATELEEQILSEEEFEKIEKSCVINLRNESSRNLKDKIIYLYESIESKYSEELEYMNDDDLADILGISKYNLKPLLKKA